MWESYEHSLRKFLGHTLATPQFFRLTIDLKKLKFVPPICELIVADRNYVDSISLSYLTSPVFQSNDVFHAVNARPNSRDPTELLITDGFCSFRFEDKLLWKDFVKLFVPPASRADAGAVLPIYVRARQDAEKCSTLGVATLTFSSFLSPDKPLSLKDMPQMFFATCLQTDQSAPPPTCSPRLVDLPVFEVLLKLPVLAKETAAVAGVLTVGIAIDVMTLTLSSDLFPPDQKPPTRLPQVLSAPTSARSPDEEFAIVERCFTDTANAAVRTGLEPTMRYIANRSPALNSSSRLISSDSAPSRLEASRGGASAGDADSSHMGGAGKDHLIQCEMMLLKLNAEQAHQKFREEVKLIEAKSEERIETIRKENQKLRSENRQLEKKLIDFEQKLQMLQDSIVRPPVCAHTCAPSSSSLESVLRKENEKLQLLLRAEREKLTTTTLNSGDAESLVPHAHSVHPVYHQPDERRAAPSYRQSILRTPQRTREPAAVAERNGSSSSSSATGSSPLSSRSRQLLAIHLKRTT